MIRSMRPDDWPRVATIFTQALEVGDLTFLRECPTYAEWDAAHLPECRFVAELDGEVVGWVAIAPSYPQKPAYWGSVELSIYVDKHHHHEGIGSALLEKLEQEAPSFGFWSLYAVVIATNQPSISLHKKCGFREIGTRERVAQDAFDHWQDIVLFEKRLSDPCNKTP